MRQLRNVHSPPPYDDFGNDNSYPQTPYENEPIAPTEPIVSTNPNNYSPPQLPNLGNSCYLNSILQILILCHHHLNILGEFNDINFDYLDFFENLKSLITTSQHHSERNVNRDICSKLKSNLSKLHPEIFDNNNQQDAHEAFLKICDTLDSGTKVILFIPSQPDNLDLSYDSLLKKLFFGTLKTTNRCSICGLNSDNSESFRNISLNPCNDINETFLSEWNRKKLRKLCRSCNKNTDHWETTSIQLKPNILVILFRRFRTQRTGRSVKINTKISLPEELTIPGFSGRLIGFIDHLGPSVNSGHYISNIKIGNSWFQCNDSHIFKTTFNTYSVYLAFYKSTD